MRVFENWLGDDKGVSNSRRRRHHVIYLLASGLPLTSAISEIVRRTAPESPTRKTITASGRTAQ